MEVVIVSDTHVPSRADGIPEPVERAIETTDHVLHAGDFDSEGTYERIREMAPELTAARGNTDPGIGLPKFATVTLEGVTFVVTHGTGSHRGYERRVSRAVREHADRSAIGVSGHTHEPLDKFVEGVRLLNPGSATGASPADAATWMVARVDDGDLTEVRLREV